jgi:hypothetical protein
VALTLIELVRDRTTSDEVLVPDSKIQAYLDHYSDVWQMAAADILEFMARDDIYEQYSRGQIRVSKPVLRERAAELRAEAIASTGVSVYSSTMSRGDYSQTDVSEEYLIQHPPYQYGNGLMRTIHGRDH